MRRLNSAGRRGWRLTLKDLHHPLHLLDSLLDGGHGVDTGAAFTCTVMQLLLSLVRPPAGARHVREQLASGRGRARRLGAPRLRANANYFQFLHPHPQRAPFRVPSAASEVRFGEHLPFCEHNARALTPPASAGRLPVAAWF